LPSSLDQLGKIGERSGQPVDLVDHYKPTSKGPPSSLVQTASTTGQSVSNAIRNRVALK
jgi:hypothetical protein